MVSIKEIKNWSPEVEKAITDEWKTSKRYNFNLKTKKKIYSIDTPPPYVNSPIHMGHAITYSFMDFFARYKRMKGFEVLFPLGLDNNGLPIEVGAEKKYNVSPFIVGREKFVEYCRKLLEEAGTTSMDSFAKIGISFCSYEKGEKVGEVYETDSPEYRALTQTTFIDLYKKGLIYEDNRINNWDPKLRTTIADSEIDYKDIPSTFNDIKWKVKETGEEIIIGTTRPELICSCGMVIFNPEDKRYQHLEGKTAITPLFNIKVPIKANPLAQIDKGTGLVMMCSAGDLSDIQFFREQKLAPIISINQDGTMNENAGEFMGLKIKDARTKVIETLKEKGLLIKQAQITHRTPISERSGAEIEFIAMPEFYLKQLEFKDDLRRIAKQINFYPPESKRILDDWIEAVSIDWPISRRRYYATSVPLWHSEEYVAVPLSGKNHQPWKEQVPKDAEVWKDRKSTGKKVSDFENLKWEGDTRVLDTWMDSSISDLYILKYKSNDEFFKKAFPATLRPQGKEIVRTWLYYTLLRGFLETGKVCFKDVWVHQHILDDKGRKMSKSLGNIVDPQEILKNYGGEAMRMWAGTEGDLSKGDVPCSKEKINAELKTLNKMLNVSRFILQFEKPKTKPKKIMPLDQVFIDYLEDLTERADENYDIYEFQLIVKELRNFLWEIFASHYLEIVKNRAYNQDKNFTPEESDSARYSLYFLLERFLTLIYPVIPQITTTIGKDLGLNLLEGEWPKAKTGKADLTLIKSLMEFNSEVWKQKKEKQLALNKEISGISIPADLNDFEKELKICHKLI
ncbi:valine--tRNA ligase [Candidatus Pacearchaeota archaeon]|nr:valine--tRNA ligase [Candidatus Pacearchaeota archaeon]